MICPKMPESRGEEGGPENTNTNLTSFSAFRPTTSNHNALYMFDNYSVIPINCKNTIVIVHVQVLYLSKLKGLILRQDLKTDLIQEFQRACILSFVHRHNCAH